MNRLRLAMTMLAFAVLALSAACSPESKAQSSLEKYEAAFKTCKKITEEAKMKPGTHRCTKITSMAVEMSMEDSGLEEAKWRPMLTSWLDKTGYSTYYADEAKRKTMPE